MAWGVSLEKLLNERVENFLVTKKINKEDFKENFKENLEKIFFPSVIKKVLKIKIGDINFKLTSKPFMAHFGNCEIEGIGSYTDIWPIVTLLTDCNPMFDKKLAEKFLKFAQTPFAFTREDLQAINPKFKLKEFDYMIETYRQYITGIAFLYTFLGC